MRAGWTTATWGDLATLEYGKALRDYKKPSGSARVFGTNGPVGWTDETPLATGPGVVIGRKGAYRGVHYSAEAFSVIDTAFYLKPKRPFDMRWAYYELLTQDINGMDSGSAIPSTSRPDFYALPVLVPPLAEQRRIANVLGDLDDLTTAERAVRATADRLLAQHLRELFGQSTASVPLSSTARFVNGGAFTKGASGDGRLVVRIAELNKGPGPSSVYSDAQVGAQHLAAPGDILFAWSGSLTVARWALPQAIINQHIFKVLPADDLPAWLVWGLLQHVLPEFKGIAADKATTMGHIQRHHLDVAVPKLEARTIQAAHPRLSALWDRALQGDVSASAAHSLRSELMHQLIAGERSLDDGAMAA